MNREKNALEFYWYCKMTYNIRQKYFAEMIYNLRRYN